MLTKEAPMRLCTYIVYGSLIVLLWAIQAHGEPIIQFDRLEVKELWVSETLKLKGAPVSNDNADYEKGLRKFVAYEKRISRLEAVIAEMRREIDGLKKTAGSGLPLPKINAKLPELAAIRKFLKKGVHMDQVRTFLGEPERTTSYGSFTTWFYPNNRKITFDTGDNINTRGTVISWRNY